MREFLHVPHPDSDPQELTSVAICGVYQVENTVTGKRYIGSSCDVRRRWGCMRSSMSGSASKAANAALRADTDLYGLSAFKFNLLTACSSEQEAERLERLLIEQTKPEYNRQWQPKTSAESINRDGSRVCKCGSRMDAKRSVCKKCAASRERSEAEKAGAKARAKRHYEATKADAAKHSRLLARKREAARKRKEKINADPELREVELQKQRTRWASRRDAKRAIDRKGLVPLIEAAKQTGVPVSTLRGWIRSGRIEASRIGRLVFLNQEQINTLLKSQ